MANIDAELEQQLKEAGKQLSHPSDSIDELLSLLDQVEKLLSKVDQSPKKSMLDALKPSMKALVQESLLKHSDIDVKVAVASCVSEITRITAPDAPYDDDQMRDIFQLIVFSFEDIADQSSRSYIKRASILETVSKVRSCVIMLDLECDALIVEMFEHFLRSVRDYHHESIYPSMESIMVLVLEESEEISVEMLKPLLASVKKDSEGVLPVARKLAEGVLLKSADKLKPYLMPAIVSLGDTLDKYSKVVASVCEGKTPPKKPEEDTNQQSLNKIDTDDSEATSNSDAEPQKRAGKKAVVAKEVKPPPKGESEDDQATSESDAEPQKQTGKKTATAKDVKLPPKDDSEDDEATGESDAKPQKRTGKKAAAAKEVNLPPKDDWEDDEATSESDAKPPKRTGKKAAAVKEVKLPPKDESEDDEATSESDAPPLKKPLSNSMKQLYKKSKLSGKKMDMGESNAKKPKQTGKNVNAKVEDSISEAKPLKLSVKKGLKSKPTAEEEEESDSENKPLKLSAKKGNSKKKDDGRKRGSGKNATENDQAKAMSSDDEMDYSPKSAAKSAKGEGSSKEIPVNSAKRKCSAVKDKVSDTIKYDKSLVGQKVKVWWPEDKMYYEGFIESFDAAKMKHKVVCVDGEKETINLKTEKWEILKEYSVRDEGVLPVTRKLGEGVNLKSADKLKPHIIPAIISMGDTIDNYTKVVASVCETATIEHNDENTSGQQPANECKLEKESKYKAHQEGACPEEVDSILDRYLKSVMTNGVDVTGNEEASVYREPSKKPEKEEINQENLNKKDTDGSDNDKESKRKDQASKKRGKEVDTVINSTEPMAGLAQKRAGRETSDQSAKKSRLSGVAGGSSLVPPRVSSSLAASVHVPFRDKDVTGLPSPQMFSPGASTPAMEEKVRQMGPSGVVDQLEGMANESAALFSHAAQSIRALERSLSDREEKVRTLNFRLAQDAVRRHKMYEEHSKRWAELSTRHAAEKKVSESRITELESLVKAKELENSELKKKLDELVCRDKGYDEKISVLEREVADLKSLDEQMKLFWEARAMDAERRATESEKRLAEAKRKMVEAEGTVKAALASFAL